MARDPGIGDYVLATKYSDGDPCDHFCVGIVSGRIPHDRYLVADNDGKQQRANGFRRAERITAEEGRQLVELMPEIGDVPGPSLWWHLATIRGETKEGDERTPDLEIVSALNEQVATLEEQNAALLAACKDALRLLEYLATKGLVDDGGNESLKAAIEAAEKGGPNDNAEKAD